MVCDLTSQQCLDNEISNFVLSSCRTLRPINFSFIIYFPAVSRQRNFQLRFISLSDAAAYELFIYFPAVSRQRNFQLHFIILSDAAAYQLFIHNQCTKYPFYFVCSIQIHIRNVRQADWRLDRIAFVETLRGHQK